MPDQGLTGAAGFLSGLNSIVLPHLERQQSLRMQDQMVQERQLRKAVQQKLEQFDLAGVPLDQSQQDAAAWLYGKSPKPPKDIANFLASDPLGVKKAFQAQGSADVVGGQQQQDPNAPGQGTVLAPQQPQQKTPLERASDKGYSISTKEGGVTVSKSAASWGERRVQEMRQVARAVENGVPFNDAVAHLEPKAQDELAGHFAKQRVDELLNSGVSLDTAFGRAMEEFGFSNTPSKMQDLQLAGEKAARTTTASRQAGLPFVGQEAEIRANVQEQHAGGISAARTGGRIRTEQALNPKDYFTQGLVAAGYDPNAGEPPTPDQIQQATGYARAQKTNDTRSQAEAKAGVQEQHAGPIAGAQEDARQATRAPYIGPNETARQAARQPFVGPNATAAEGARNEVNPKQGYLAQKAVAGDKNAQAVQGNLVDQVGEKAGATRRAQVGVDVEQKPVEDSSLYRHPDTLEPAPPGLTIGDAKKQGFVKLNTKDTNVVLNLGRLENAMERYKALVPQLYPYDNAARNFAHIAKLRASGSEITTEFDALMPEITVLSRLSGERGQTTEKDIARAAKGIAYGTKYAKRVGIDKAIAQSEMSMDSVRKTLGFHPRVKAGGTQLNRGESQDLGDGVTVRRID